MKKKKSDSANLKKAIYQPLSFRGGGEGGVVFTNFKRKTYPNQKYLYT